MCCAQLCCIVALFGVLASFGSFQVMFWPVLCCTPLPASGYHCQSVPVWAPYFPTEKLESLLRLAPSLATQSIMGTVIIDCAPTLLLMVMKVSPRSPAVELASPRLSKYQSWPRLSALNCQLYRAVELPPLRLSGA